MILFFLAVSGLSFLIKETDGPFGILGTTRNCLCKLPLVGVEVFKLLECNFCLSFWVSIGLWLIERPNESLFISVFAGAFVNWLIFLLVDLINAKIFSLEKQ